MDVYLDPSDDNEVSEPNDVDGEVEVEDDEDTMFEVVPAEAEERRTSGAVQYQQKTPA